MPRIQISVRLQRKEHDLTLRNIESAEAWRTGKIGKAITESENAWSGFKVEAKSKRAELMILIQVTGNLKLDPYTRPSNSGVLSGCRVAEGVVVFQRNQDRGNCACLDVELGEKQPKFEITNVGNQKMHGPVSDLFLRPYKPSRLQVDAMVKEHCEFGQSPTRFSYREYFRAALKCHSDVAI
ncbi:hypothetical protein ARMSODRAFT_981502 [Armillaria solidipes]|uniref:Uncharacterized protein n=1 Tax=Armillaria solidipes TaxID=1076256 RepID=A0A2H3BAD6_9AGAR|nr:hypothetical protein ARMSODRAFT_981502 [Armillaria solidipes]